MWQRARLIRHGTTKEQYGLINRLFYVAACPPFDVWNRPGAKWFISNIISPNDSIRLREVDASYTELLPEFAEDVPLISWADFLAGKEQ